jgi:hypothetical protein
MAQLARVAQDPSSVTRQVWEGGAIAAGSGGQSSKFVAHAAILLFSLNAYTTIAGTSTYTYTGPNGTSTIAVASQQLSVIRVYNTAAAGSSVSLATATYGPFALGGAFVTSGTLTNQVGAGSQFVLNTALGTAGYGGIPINQGDYVYVVTGTDATATEVVSIDWQHPQNVALTA